MYPLKGLCRRVDFGYGGCNMVVARGEGHHPSSLPFTQSTCILILKLAGAIEV